MLGVNGSGKTTLLRAISGDIDYRGKIEIDGSAAASLNARKRAQALAVVRQRINIPFQIKVVDFVLMGRYPKLDWWSSYGSADRQRVGDELERMGISELGQRHLDEISGGELQKVLLARALVQDTPWLLLDEPGQQLDPRNRKELYDLLHALAGQGKKIICSTHDREAVESGPCRVLGLKDGHLIYDQEGEIAWEEVWEKIYS